MSAAAPPASPPTSTPHRGLASWIAASLVVAVLMATLVLLGLVERFARENATRTALGALHQIGWQMRDQLDTGMSYRYEEIRILAGLDELQPGSHADRVRPVLERVQASFPQYAWLGYVRADGTVLAANGRLLEGRNVAERPWFKGASKGPYVGDLHPAVLLEKLLPKQTEPWRFVDVAVPVRDRSGAVTHVLGAHLSWEWARELQRDLLAPAVVNYGAQVFVVERNGRVLLGPPGTEGKPLPLPAFDPGRLPPAGAMLAWADGTTYATSLVATRGHGRYPGLGWTVVVRQPEQVAFADYQRLRHELILAGLLTCLVAAACASFVARRLTNPLTALTDVIRRRGEGEATAIPRLQGYAEVGLLSQALADLSEREAQHLQSLRQVNERLERTVQERTREISERERELRTILEQTSEAFIRIDSQGRVLEWNRHAEETFGWTRSEAVGAALADLVIPPDQHQAHHHGMSRYLGTGMGHIVDRRVELPARHKAGHLIDVEMIVSATHHAGGVTFNAFLHDIGERKRLEIELREGRERLRAVTDNVPALVAQLDRDLRFAYANMTYRHWFDVDPATLIGQSMSELYGDEAVQSWQPWTDRVLAGERVQFERSMMVKGQRQFTTATYLPQHDASGAVVGFYALVSDTTATKELELRLQNEALHDALTGLPNRRQLTAQLPQAMARADRQGLPLGLLFLDLNGFKGVNDTHGHEAGDQLLQQVAERLRGAVRKGDTVVRLAGDEFVVLLEPVGQGMKDAQGLVDKIDALIRQPFTLSGVQVCISVSTGVELYEPGSGRSAEQLMSGADAAMYRAKKASHVAQA